MGAACSGAAGAEISGRPAQNLCTFLVSSPQALPKAFNTRVPADLRADLGGVLLLTIGWATKDLEPYCVQFGCPVYIVETYGVIGWSVDMEMNTESEEKGRGSEYGAPGNPKASPGISLIAVRKRGPGRSSPVLSVDGEAPGIADGARAHCIFARFENQPEMQEFMSSRSHAVGAGGFCKKVYELAEGGWVDRKMVLLTLMESPTSAVNVCFSYGVYDTDGCKCNSQKEGRVMLDTLPAGYKPMFVGQFQCFMRGFNAYSAPDVEAKSLANLVGSEVPVFGMSCFGEIGNCTAHNPDGWNSGHRSSEVTWFHSFCTVLCVYAERSSEAWPRPPLSNVVLREEAEEFKDERFGVVQTQCFDAVETMADKHPEAYKTHLRRVLFKDVGVPDAEGISFWKVPGGMDAARCYSKSAAVESVDVFISHALKADPSCPTDMMRRPIKYSIHKCVDIFVGSHSIVSRWVAEGKVKREDEAKAMQGLTFWCDTACVDHSDTKKKMFVLQNHLEDFVQHSKYFMCLMSTQYFTRLWCLYEFACACKRRENLDTILVANACLAFFEQERVKIAESIASASVAKASCFNPGDRSMIEAKIRREFASVPAFERFLKFSACALAARQSVFWAVEHYARWLWLWSDTARLCGFSKLAAVIVEVDVGHLREEVFTALPDTPAESRTLQRMGFFEEHFTKTWFDTKLAPLLQEELRRAMA